MKYLIMIHSNPASREIWAGMSDAVRATGFSAYAALNEALAESGEAIAHEALTAPAEGKVVTARGGRITTVDGPFAEAKEHLAGFYLVDCDSEERAIELAARIPEAEYGLVEVRPILDLSEYGL